MTGMWARTGGSEVVFLCARLEVTQEAGKGKGEGSEEGRNHMGE